MKISYLFFLFAIVYLNSEAQVIQEWAARYGNPDRGVYTVTSPQIDNAGNVFVSGSVKGTSLTDYVTVKYNSSGVEQWSKIFTGLIEDRVIDMKLDNFGNVCVTGLSENHTGTYDIITIKYDNADGDSLWVKRYNSSAGPFTMDQPVALDVDASGNVYVLGYTFGTTPMTIVTIKYNTNGDTLWIANHLMGGTDLPRDIYVDTFGNVYVYARGLRMIKYNSSGQEQWSRDYAIDATESNRSLTGDASGNIYFNAVKSTSTLGDFSVTKIDPNGEILWSSVRNGFGGTTATHDDPRAIYLDNFGNVYMTGEIYESGRVNYSTIKYNSSGNFQWERNFADTLNGEGAYDIKGDALGNIYVTGASNDYATIKYNTNGDVLWTIRYNGPDNLMDLGSGIAVDKLNNVYVSGRSRFASGSLDYVMATVKYSQSMTSTSVNESTLNGFYLLQNYPNPFNPVTNLEFEIPRRAKDRYLEFGSLKVFDITGKLVQTIAEQRFSPGMYKFQFDGNDIPSGIYFCKLQTESFSETKRMILLK